MCFVFDFSLYFEEHLNRYSFIYLREVVVSQSGPSRRTSQEGNIQFRDPWKLIVSGWPRDRYLQTTEKNPLAATVCLALPG